MAVVANLIVRVSANLTELDKTFSELERAADKIAKTYAKLGSQLQGIGSKLTTGITLPLAGIGAAALKSAMDFDTAMKGVEAAIQPTTAEMDQLKAAAIEWGQKTQFSATEAAQALGELGKAGVSSSDSVKLLPAVLNLATVGEMDLAEAAATTTDTLAQFNLSAKDAGRVNDVLAAGAQKSTTSVKELRQAMISGGQTAGSFGMSIEETTGALASFANVGLKGEKAGTALKNVVTAIVNPMKGMNDVLGELNIKTLASADGTVHLAEVVEKLGRAGADNSQIVRAFGEVAGPVMVSMVGKGSGAITDMTTAMEKSGGTADRVAKTLLSGLGGAWEQMTGAVETAAISIGLVLAPALEAAAGLVGDLASFISTTVVPAFEALPKAVKITAGAFVGLLAAAGPLVYLAGTMAQSWSGLVGLFAKSAGAAGDLAGATGKLTLSLQAEALGATVATAATTAFEAVVAVLTSPITLTVAAVAALVLGLRALTGSWDGVVRVLSGGILDFQTLERVWTNLQTIAGEVGGALSDLGTILSRELQPVLDKVDKLVTSVGNAFSDPMATGVRDLNDAANEASTGGLARLLQTLATVSALPIISTLERLVAVQEKAAKGAQVAGAWMRYYAGSGEYAADATDRSAASFRDYVTGIANVSSVTAMGGLTAGQFGDAMNRLAVGGGPVVRVLADVAEGSGKVGAATKASAAAIKAAAEAAKKAAEDFQALVDAMTGATVIAKARELMTVFAALTARGLKPSAEGLKTLTDALADAAAVAHSKGGQMAEDMVFLYAALIPPARSLGDDLSAFANEIARFARGLVPSLKSNLKPVTQAVFDAFRIDGERLGKQLERDLADAALADRLKKMLAGIGTQLQTQMSTILGGMFSGQTGFADGFRSMFGVVQGIAGEIMGNVVKEMTTEFKKGVDGSLGSVFSGKDAKKGAAAGAAVGLAAGLAFGSAFGKEVGALAGAASGAAAGAMFGSWVGAGVGAGVGFFTGLLAGIEKESQQRAALDAAKSDLVAQFGNLSKLSHAAAQAGVDFDAMWDTTKPAEFNKWLVILQNGLSANKDAVDGINKGLDETIRRGDLLSKFDITEVAGATGRRGAPGQVARGALPGSEEGAFAFIQKQQSAAIAGLDTFLTNAKVKTEAGAMAISASIAGIYQTLLESGATPTQAFAQMEPVIAKLQAQLAASGLAASAAFGPLGVLAGLAADEIAGPVMDAMAGLEQGLTSTANLGLLNQETFGGFAAEMLAGFKALEAQGKGGEVALAGMQGGLQKLWELSTDFGYTLEPNEQAMLDFAVASGTVGDKFRPSADRMANAIDGLVERMDRFIAKFDEMAQAMADSGKQGANAMQSALDGIKPPKLKIPTELEPPEGVPPGNWRYATGGTSTTTSTIPAFGAGAVVRRPTVALIGESGPEAVVPLGKDFGTAVDMTVMLDSEVLTRAVLRKQPRILRAYGAAR